MKLYEEFKLYETLWETTLTEGAITHYCDNCMRTVQLDDNAMCPNCSNGISYLTDLVAEVLSEDSKLYIIYNADKESVNKADLNLATGHINKGAEVVQVTKEFFKQLEPVIHDETPEDSNCGKVLLKNEPKIIQLVLTELRHHTSILEKELGKPAKQIKQSTSGSSNNQAPGQQKINFDEEFKLYENMWESIPAALKEFVSMPSNTSKALKWEDLLIKADKLLEELCIKSGNSSWDDGDGYWSGDEEWCNRKLYYARLADTAKLEKLCDDYSKKLSNVEFYFYDDEEEETSEIGYIATKE